MNPQSPQQPATHWSDWLPSLILLLLMLGLEGAIVYQNGHLAYPIDDPYIHMAMARHLVQDGIYGVSQAEFTASSSSPAWTLLLSGMYFLFGPQEWPPVALNLLIGMFLLFWLTRRARQYSASPYLANGFSLFLLFILPLPALIALGMEHTLHGLLVLLWVDKAISLLLSGDHRQDWKLILLGLASTSVRYESIFIAAPLTLLFVLKQDWKRSLYVPLSCLLPILVLGIIQIRQGWFFLPSSIAVKSAAYVSGWHRIEQTLARWTGQFINTGHILFPFLACLLALLYTFEKRKTLFTPSALWCLCTCVTIFLHCGFASIGWFYRYEAYLLALTAAAISPWLWSGWDFCKRLCFIETNKLSQWIGRCLTLIAGVFLISLFSHNLHSLGVIVPGARNIHQQQYQMGLFLKEYFEGHTVVANDIGAMNYLADIHCLDIGGLASTEPIRANWQDRWSPRFMQSWAQNRGATLAIVYDSWVKNVRPPSWHKVGEWTVPEKITVADTTVSFYALHPNLVEPLRRSLDEFRNRLPQGVECQIIENNMDGPTP